MFWFLSPILRGKKCRSTKYHSSNLQYGGTFFHQMVLRDKIMVLIVDTKFCHSRQLSIFSQALVWQPQQSCFINNVFLPTATCSNNANDANDALTTHTLADGTLAHDEAVKTDKHEPARLKCLWTNEIMPGFKFHICSHILSAHINL